MFVDSQNPENNPGEIRNSAAASGQSGGNDSVSSIPLAEAAVAEPNPTVTIQPPPGFVRLKAYCDEHGLKSEIDLDETFPNVAIEFRNGRSMRAVFVGNEEAADALLHYSLEGLVFLGEYSAICSYDRGWIEAAVRAAGARSSIQRRNIFGVRGLPDSKEPKELELTGPKGLTIKLTEKRGCLYWLDYGAPLYLRIEGIGITEHDQAMNLLEDLSNSLFLQIDLRFDSPLILSKGRFPSRRFFRSRGRLDEDSQMVFPRFSYERSPSALYWYARSASSMPLLQFLAFYQCLEFYFPQYSRQEAIAKIKNILKDPVFDGTKDSSINVILNATIEGHRCSLIEERKQLLATLKQCVDPSALRDFFCETEERKRYYEHDFKKISQKKITFSEGAPVLEQTAERIYDIRCKVVHTKNTDAGERVEIILPFSEEEDLLIDDVELIKFLARKVLIASGVLLAI